MTKMPHAKSWAPSESMGIFGLIVHLKTVLVLLLPSVFRCVKPQEM